MRIVTNTRLIKRNARIGQITTLAALIMLVIATYLAVTQKAVFFSYTLFLMLISFFLTQVGLYFGNRWGRRPRPDEILDKSLKGLGREYTMYHYITPASHLLVGPAGVWVLLTYHTAGIVTYKKRRYRQHGGGFATSYLRLFGQESLGRPDLEAKSEMDLTRQLFRRLLPDQEIPIQAALVFLHPQAQIALQDSPLPVLHAKDLKDFLRRRSKEDPLPPATLAAIQSVLPKPKDET